MLKCLNSFINLKVKIKTDRANSFQSKKNPELGLKTQE